MSPKVAVVTGANNGIGLAIVRGLCKRFDGDVYLTSRDVQRGNKAVQELEKTALHPKYHQLDVTDKQSVDTFRDYIKENYDGIDVLINNVGLFNDEDPKQTFDVNYYGLISTCDTLFPILKRGARVVNLSSAVGHLSHIPDADLRNKLKDSSLTVPELTALVEEYLEALSKGTQGPKWGNSPYVVSKVAVSALSKIQQRLVDDRESKIEITFPRKTIYTLWKKVAGTTPERCKKVQTTLRTKLQDDDFVTNFTPIEQRVQQLCGMFDDMDSELHKPEYTEFMNIMETLELNRVSKGKNSALRDPLS